MACAISSVMARARRLSVGGPKPLMLRSAAEGELEEAWVASVSVVVALAAPGVTLVGENVAAHLLGSPAHASETAESYEPCWAVSSIV